MQPMRKHYLHFSTRQTTGIIILLAIVVLVFSLPYFSKQAPTDLQVLTLSNTALQMDDVNMEKSMPDDAPLRKALHLFYFDPNTIDSTGMVQMGLRQKLIQTILHYRNKGGKFFKPEDIRKIWGLFPEEANAMLPFIQIQSLQNAAGNKPTQTVLAFHSVELNQADVQAFRQIPGISPALAYGIVHYREKLEGFVQTVQLKQVPGFPDSLYATIEPYIYINVQQIPKININRAEPFALLHHPFIPENVAKAILILRKQQGSFQSVADLQKIPFLNAETYRQISAFCTVE
ncbi:helix-hairpin-helix domain-containing protein [Hydrotalea sp.]|uniref:helix-hairpin-helix domain-containing protein n=1 Tax=Hydrotalea sp. TaxID=2881279 RepID=UPI00258CB4B4|nr:helix-hairpin-helix domain-containing protein [Hydrotalea sp.]